MEIVVMNKHSAEEYSLERHEESSVIISISSCKNTPAYIIPNKVANIKEVLFLEFNDTDSTKFLDGGILSKDAKQICDFVNKYKDDVSLDKIIVHCEAGQSRSAGVAAAIMKYLNNDDTPIFNNHRYTPNMSCYRAVLNKFMENM